MNAIITVFISDTSINPAETGWYYLKSRYYDPEVGRFLNADEVDVLTTEQNSFIQFNICVYCLNDPINCKDSNGYLATATIGAIVGGAIAGAWNYCMTQYVGVCAESASISLQKSSITFEREKVKPVSNYLGGSTKKICGPYRRGYTKDIYKRSCPRMRSASYFYRNIIL